LQIKQLKIKNFRCFIDIDVNFQGALSVISGDNGAGKTSLLEALHYLCYMRSFRTHSPKDLIQFDSNEFFVKASFLDKDNLEAANALQVGFSQNKKIVKLNNKTIGSFKDLMDYYRIITLTEDDLWLIKGGPDVRRSFLDQAILLLDYSFGQKIKEYKKVLEQRNSLLLHEKCSPELYDLWTAQLWEKSLCIQQERKELLGAYEGKINEILGKTFDETITVSLAYKSKNVRLEDSFEQFMATVGRFKHQEFRFRRSLFGAHLDDFTIDFQQRKSKFYASRGQQKLVVLLLKAAQLLDLGQKRGPAVFLLDDFMTDFDEEKATLLAHFLLSLDCQLIFTSPSKSGFFEGLLFKLGASKVVLPY